MTLCLIFTREQEPSVEHKPWGTDYKNVPPHPALTGFFFKHT
jgi:hypothetical protein